MEKSLLIATGNAGKIKELRELLQHLPVQLVLPAQLGLDMDVQEIGNTYADNALLKARAYAEAARMPVLADDSGIEVDRLGGAPGIYSARYAPQPGATDADRRRYMLSKLAGRERPWTARFRCVVAVALVSGEHYLTEGVCEGEIISEERGTTGFGYDPIFMVAGKELTMAELSMEEKNKISHRGRAVTAALPILRNIYHLPD